MNEDNNSKSNKAIEVIFVSPSAPLAATLAALGILAFTVLTLVAGSTKDAVLPGMALLSMLVLTGIGVIQNARQPKRRLNLGADGVCFRHGERVTFVPWRRVEGLRRSAQGLVLHIKGGSLLIGAESRPGMLPQVFEVPEWAPGFEFGGDLAELIDAAKAARSGRVPLCTQRIVDEYDPVEWEHALREALRCGGYRGGALARTDLVEDMCNPDAPPKLRAAIARVVRPRVDEIPRVRVAAEATAEPGVQEALEQALKVSEA